MPHCNRIELLALSFSISRYLKTDFFELFFALRIEFAPTSSQKIRVVTVSQRVRDCETAPEDDAQPIECITYKRYLAQQHHRDGDEVETAI